MIEVTVLYIGYIDEDIHDLLFSVPVKMNLEMYPYTTDCTIGKITLENSNQFSVEFRNLFKIDDNLKQLNLERDDLKRFNDDILWVEIKNAAS